jgi:hypothetical protein
MPGRSWRPLANGTQVGVFRSVIVPANGTSAANWREWRFRYVAVFWAARGIRDMPTKVKWGVGCRSAMVGGESWPIICRPGTCRRPESKFSHASRFRSMSSLNTRAFHPPEAEPWASAPGSISPGVCMFTSAAEAPLLARQKSGLFAVGTALSPRAVGSCRFSAQISSVQESTEGR